MFEGVRAGYAGRVALALGTGSARDMDILRLSQGGVYAGVLEHIHGHGMGGFGYPGVRACLLGVGLGSHHGTYERKSEEYGAMVSIILYEEQVACRLYLPLGGNTWAWESTR
jgi:hypothetical protein